MSRQTKALLRGLTSPYSRLETFSDDAKDPFDQIKPKFRGLTYEQALELYHKDRDLYNEILKDSSFD